MEYIKKLRDTTGSGIVDCKKALSENNNDIDAAIKWLREKGILKAQKKQDRDCLLYTSPSPRDLSTSRMPSSA